MLSICLGMTLTGCMDITPDYFVYGTDKAGELVCYNKVKHKDIVDYKVVVFELDGKQSVFIADVIETPSEDGVTKHQDYYDIFGHLLVYDEENKDTNLKIVNEEYLTSYLLTYGKVQTEYSESDLKEVLELIKTDYENENNKKLVKE